MLLEYRHKAAAFELGKQRFYCLIGEETIRCSLGSGDGTLTQVAFGSGTDDSSHVIELTTTGEAQVTIAVQPGERKDSDCSISKR